MNNYYIVISVLMSLLCSRLIQSEIQNHISGEEEGEDFSEDFPNFRIEEPEEFFELFIADVKKWILIFLFTLLVWYLCQIGKMF